MKHATATATATATLPPPSSQIEEDEHSQQGHQPQCTSNKGGGGSVYCLCVGGKKKLYCATDEQPKQKNEGVGERERKGSKQKRTKETLLLPLSCPQASLTAETQSTRIVVCGACVCVCECLRLGRMGEKGRGEEGASWRESKVVWRGGGGAITWGCTLRRA